MVASQPALNAAYAANGTFNENKTMNLLEDNIKKLYMRYLIPAVGGAMIIAVYSFVDMLAVGKGVGPDGSAAIAVVMPVFNLADFFGFLTGVGGAVLISVSQGRGEIEKKNEQFTASFLLTVILAASSWAVLYFFMEEIFRLFGASEELLPYCIGYGKYIIYAYPTFLLVGYLSCVVRNDNDPFFVLAGLISGAVCNSLGDYIFVFVLKMGIDGAGLASASGSVIQCIILSIHFLRKSNTLRFAKVKGLIQAFISVVKNGFGASFVNISLILSYFFLNNQIMKYSDESALAVYGVISTLGVLFQGVFSGIGEAAQPIISENYGGGKKDRILEIHRMALAVSLAFGAVCTLAGVIFPVGITNLLVTVTEELTPYVYSIVPMFSLSFVFKAFNTYVLILFQSLEKSRAAMVLSICEGASLNICLLFLFSTLMGTRGIWLSITATEVIVAVVSAFLLSGLKLNKKTNVAS